MKVSDQYRTNPLSLTPGGSEVQVVFLNGQTREYDKVKFPRKFVGRIEGKENIVQIRVDGKLVWEDSHQLKFWEEPNEQN